jgi:hypothetical protein
VWHARIGDSLVIDVQLKGVLGVPRAKGSPRRLNYNPVYRYFNSLTYWPRTLPAGEQPSRNCVGNTNRLGKCKEYTAFDKTDPTTCSGVGLTGKPCVNQKPTEEQLNDKRWQWATKPGSGKKYCPTCKGRLVRAEKW